MWVGLRGSRKLVKDKTAEGKECIGTGFLTMLVVQPQVHSSCRGKLKVSMKYPCIIVLDDLRLAHIMPLIAPTWAYLVANHLVKQDRKL